MYIQASDSDRAKYCSTFGVMQLLPGTEGQEHLLRALNASQSVLGNPALTLLTLPLLPAVTLQPARILALEKAMDPLFSFEGRHQYCLKTKGLPDVRAFLGPRNIMSGDERIHAFDHYSVGLHHRLNGALLDPGAQELHARVCRFGKVGMTVAYLAECKNRGIFDAFMENAWVHFCRFLEGRDSELATDPFAFVPEGVTLRQPAA